MSKAVPLQGSVPAGRLGKRKVVPEGLFPPGQGYLKPV